MVPAGAVLSLDAGWPVSSPDIPQRIADLTDRGLGGERGAQRDQHVLRTRRGPLQLADLAAPLVTVPAGPQLRQPFRLFFLDGGIDPQRLVAGLGLGDELVNPHHDALARVYLARHLVGRSLDLALLEATSELQSQSNL